MNFGRTNKFLLQIACAICLVQAGLVSAGMPKYQPEDIPGTTWDESIDRFKTIDAAARGVPLGVSAPATISAYVEAGITMSDMACEQWFDVLGRDEQKTGFFKDVLNVAGNLILGVAGLNGVSSSSLARGSLFMSAGNASIDSYRSNFIRGVVSAVKEVVWRNRKEYINAFNAAENGKPHTYDTGKRVLIEFHRLCSPEHIDRIVRDTLPDARYTADTSLEKEKVSAAQVARTRQLSKLLFDENGVSVDSEVMYKLYVVEIVKPVTGGTKVRADEYAKDKSTAEASTKLAALDTKQQAEVRALIQEYADSARFPAKWTSERQNLPTVASGQAQMPMPPGSSPATPPGTPAAKTDLPSVPGGEPAKAVRLPSLVYQPARRLRD